MYFRYVTQLVIASSLKITIDNSYNVYITDLCLLQDWPQNQNSKRSCDKANARFRVMTICIGEVLKYYLLIRWSLVIFFIHLVIISHSVGVTRLDQHPSVTCLLSSTMLLSSLRIICIIGKAVSFRLLHFDTIQYQNGSSQLGLCLSGINLVHPAVFWSKNDPKSNLKIDSLT